MRIYLIQPHASSLLCLQVEDPTGAKFASYPAMPPRPLKAHAIEVCLVSHKVRRPFPHACLSTHLEYAWLAMHRILGFSLRMLWTGLPAPAKPSRSFHLTFV
jgi:hypothetical protein